MDKEMIFMTAARGERPETTPIWMEVQMLVVPSHKEMLRRYGFQGICRSAELSARSTVDPIYELGVDAAIHFSDLLVPVEAMGVEVAHSFEGPRLSHPVRSRSDVEKLFIPEPEDGMSLWLEALRIAKKELAGKVPVIGWVGAPFNLASFLLAGGPPAPYDAIKKVMYGEPDLLHSLMCKLTEMVMRFLPAQLEAGADVLMLFDGAAGLLSPKDYEQFVFPYLRKIGSVVKSKGVPLIYHTRGYNCLVSPLVEAGVSIIHLDWTVDIGRAVDALGGKGVIQGNLDPMCLFAPEEVMQDRASEVLEEGKAAPAHIFSLGGRVHKDTPVEKAKLLVEIVHGREAGPASTTAP
jgi:uroporphyrinogen decarboxylase